MTQQFNNLINGEWVGSRTYSPNINPSDVSDVVGEYAQAEISDVELAVEAARAAFSAWSTTTPQVRFDALDKIGNELLARKDELGALLAREEGKTRSEAVAEVARAGGIFKFFAGECLRLSGETLPSVRVGVTVDIVREPVGVVGLITPWNFPIAIPAWKIAPALAYGNTVVIKPADLVPGSLWALAEIIHRSGVLNGAFNLVMGKGRTVGEALVNHQKVDAISFTGSQQVGAAIARSCANQMKKCQLEMGGKNPQIVLDDANLVQAVELCTQSAFYQAGQRCTASSRIIVTDGVYSEFISALKSRVARIQVGDALAENTDMGPVVSSNQLEQNLSYIDIARHEGAYLALGGSRLRLEKDGFYMSPALITESTPDMRINREEVFGPVASVIRVKDYEQALWVANDTPFGLAAGIATNSLKYASHFKRNSQAGMVMVNLPTAGVDYHVPFGGRKGSSYGPREQGKFAQEFFTSVKTAYVMA